MEELRIANEFKEESFGKLMDRLTLERYKQYDLIRKYNIDSDGIVTTCIFSARAFALRFEDKPINIVFHDLTELFQLDRKILDIIKKRTYYFDEDILIEYGKAIIEPFEHRAIFIFNLADKILHVYLLNADTDMLLAMVQSKTITKPMYSYIKKLFRNFEYIEHNFGNLLTISDQMLFDFDLSENRYEQFWDILIPETKKRFWMINESDYSYVASFIILTYLQEMLDTAPYIFVGGEKGSGKTRVLETIVDMGWRTSETSSISVAVLSRELDWHRSVMVLDEMAKDEEGKVTADEKELNAILRAGIRRGGRYKRMKNQEEIGSYNVFGIKAFATNRILPSDIMDRCLIITMFRNPKFKPKPRQKYPYINRFLSELRILFIVRKMFEKMKDEVNKLRASLVEANIDPRFSEIVAPLFYLMPEKYLPNDLKDKLQRRLEEDKFTETYYMYYAIKYFIDEKITDENGNLKLDEIHKKHEILFKDIFLKFLELQDIDFEKLTERDKRSLLIRAGLVIKNKFGFESISRSVRNGDRVYKEKYIVVEPMKFISFRQRFEENIEIGNINRSEYFFETFKKLSSL